VTDADWGRNGGAVPLTMAENLFGVFSEYGRYLKWCGKKHRLKKANFRQKGGSRMLTGSGFRQKLQNSQDE
jgi:hypothetical protein